MRQQSCRSSRNLPANGESTTRRADAFLSPRIVAREAAKVAHLLRVELRPAQLRKLVTRFIRDGHTTLDPLRVYVIAYADPTGERAVRNVMREQRTT